MNQTGNLDLIKRMNRTLVLELIRSEQPISRALVARRLGLSRSTVSHIVDDLLEKKLLVELGFGDSTKEGGRRGIELGFNPRSAFGIGIELSDRGIFYIVTDLNGDIIYEQYAKLTTKIDEMKDGIHQFIAKSGIELSKILGLGIAVPSVVDSTNAIVMDAVSLGWKDMNLKEFMTPYFPFPIYVSNDVNSAALGERWLGSGKDSNDMFFISIGSGVGSAIISNGQLILGHSFSAGEIGYFINQHDIDSGAVNEIGHFGVFERNINKLLIELDSVPGKKLEFTNYLSIALANVISLLNPEKVVIGGIRSASIEVHLENIQKQVQKLTPFSHVIEMGSLNEKATALGAVYSVFERIQETL